MSVLEMKLKRDPEVLIDFTDWEFDDDFTGELDLHIKRLLKERVQTLFGDNGISASLYLYLDSDRGSDRLEVCLEIEQAEAFAQAEVNLFEFLEDAVEGDLTNHPKGCADFAARLRRLADRVEKWGESGAVYGTWESNHKDPPT